MSQEISFRIKKIREYRNYTQAYMATQLKICQNTYSKIENGFIALKPDRLGEIAKILEVQVSDILNSDMELLPVKATADNDPVTIIAMLEKMLHTIQDELVDLKAQNKIIIRVLERQSIAHP